MKTYFCFDGDNGREVIVLPSITPNPSQQRIGIRIGKHTVWMRHKEALDFAAQVKKVANE